MKKLLFVLILSFIFFNLSASPSKEENFTDEITVYAYSSFCNQWGPGQKLAEDFYQKTGIKVRLIASDNALDVYNKFVFEGKASPADLLIGLSDTMKINTDLFEKIELSCEDSLVSLDKNSPLIPFDYGTFAFVFDTYNNTIKPEKLQDLTKVIYKNKIIMIDPRTSSVGLGMLMWTISALGEEKAFEWWEEVKPNILTVCSSWSSAYALFTENEAPLVISYTTSPVYHLMYENSDRYQALEFTDGHLNTVEFMAVPKTSAHKESVAKFCEYLLNEGQSDIAVANTMFPANSDTVLPEEFSIAVHASKILEKPSVSKIDYYTDRWVRIMTAR